MKKIVYIMISIVVLMTALGLIYYQREADRMDQIKLQYENEIISTLERELVFAPFEDALKNQTQEDKDRVRGLILGKAIQGVEDSIEEKTLTVEEVVLFYIERIKAYNDDYKAVIQLNPYALLEAKELDKRIQQGEAVGDLAGSVILIKDNVSAINMNTAAGAYVLKDLTTNRDAFVVETIKREDGIILGKNNLSEWSNFMSHPSSNGFSVLGGQTKNAYGQYDVGGSSSGPAVASAMNFASISIGSETSGSLIYPASQNSIVAIKPTLGVLSRDLVIPISEAQDTLGFMGRQVADVYKVFKSTVAVDPEDKAHASAQALLAQSWPDKLDADYLKGRRLGLVSNGNSYEAQLIKELEKLGATVEMISFDEGDLDIDMLSVLNYGMVNDLHAYLNNEAVNAPVKSLKEVREFNKKESYLYMPYGDTYHEMAIEQNLNKEEIETIIQKNRRLTQEAIDHMLRDNDLEVLVSFSNDLSSVYAAAGYPALTVPAGYKESGEPYGVTFVGSHLDDIKLFQVGYAYEQGTNHRKITIVKGKSDF